MKRFSMVLFVSFLGVSAYAGEKRDTEGVGLTIYTTTLKDQDVWRYGRREKQIQCYATVKNWRRMKLSPGVTHIRFTDVASAIMPETVHFVSLTDPDGTFVLEQNYEYDLLSARKLLTKYIDRPITIIREPKEGELEQERVILLSTSGSDCVFRRDDPENPIEIRRYMPRVRLGALPGGLITRPTLVWTVKAKKGGDHLCKVTYETKGISWKATYTALTRKDETALDLSGWVTIENRSGATYENAEIKLVAGDVHAGARRTSTTGGTSRGTGGGRAKMRTREHGFSEKAFFEFYLYTLGRKSTLKNRSQKQLELFSPVTGIPVTKSLVYFGLSEFPFFFVNPITDRSPKMKSNSSVDIYLTFRNSKDAGLGISLPNGTVRVYKEDPEDGSLEFIGEDEVGHGAVDEDVMLRLGSAFDMVGERRQTDFKCKYKEHWMEESFEILLRNHKEKDVEVIVREVLFRWLNWQVLAKSDDYEKMDSRTIHFPVTVPANGEKKVTYTVKYTW